MILFLQHSLSFPTFLYSLLLVIVIIYWLITAVGLLDMDSLDIDIPSTDSDIPVTGLSGLLIKFRLTGIPVTITFSIFALYAWFISYFCQYLLLDRLSFGILSYLIGFIALILVAFAALFLTSITVQPLRRWLNLMKNEAMTSQTLMGRQVVVRSFRVTPQHGEAVLEDGGAGLILKIRAPEENAFTTGDHVVIVEYNPSENSYTVVSELEFRGFA